MIDRYRLHIGQYCGDACKKIKQKTNKCYKFTFADEIDRFLRILKNIVAMQAKKKMKNKQMLRMYHC